MIWTSKRLYKKYIQSTLPVQYVWWIETANRWTALLLDGKKKYK